MQESQVQKKRSSSLVATIIALVCVAFLSLVLVGCSSPEQEAKDALNQQLQTLKSGNFNDLGDANQQLAASIPADKLNDLESAWTESFEYEIGDATMEGSDTCNINVTLTSKLLTTTLKNSVSDIMALVVSPSFSDASSADINAAVVDILLKNIQDQPTETSDLVVTMNKTSNGWTPSEESVNEIITKSVGNLSNLASEIESM